MTRATTALPLGRYPRAPHTERNVQVALARKPLSFVPSGACLPRLTACLDRNQNGYAEAVSSALRIVPLAHVMVHRHVFYHHTSKTERRSGIPLTAKASGYPAANVMKTRNSGAHKKRSYVAYTSRYERSGASCGHPVWGTGREPGGLSHSSCKLTTAILCSARSWLRPL